MALNVASCALNLSSTPTSVRACSSVPTIKVGRLMRPSARMAAIFSASPLLTFKRPLTSIGQGWPFSVTKRHSCVIVRLL